MRISDWSADVCSSDLDHRIHDRQLRDAGDRPHHQLGGEDQLYVGRPDALPGRVPRPERRRVARRRAAQPEFRALVCQRAGADRDFALRSEENTYELQSLMRLSYAVFCLKKKKET